MAENPRVLNLSTQEQIKEALRKIKVHPGGIQVMTPKAIHRLVKVEAVDFRAANILKQDMLSRGGEVAISRSVYDLNAKKTDLIIMGTLRQFRELFEKMKRQPFGLASLADEVKAILENSLSQPSTVKIGKHTFDFNKRSYIMGILNVTLDSFSDGGRYFSLDHALSHGLSLIEEGADLIDVGGESTRPGAKPVNLEEELRRVIPPIEKLAEKTDIPISIDTYKPEVARRALEAGAVIINDISGLRDKKMVQLAVEKAAFVCIMHMKGTPQDMQESPTYDDVVGEIIDFLRAQAQMVIDAGLEEKRIMIDPGIGFGKNLEHNLEIMRKLSEFKSLGYPLLLGPSRKSFIGMALDLPVEERLEGTAAAVALAIAKGANILRVHDVKEMVRVAKMTDVIVKIR